MSDPETETEARWLSETVGVRRLASSVITITDRDARSWLNGQITNDVRRAEREGAVYALAVDVHGKIVADPWVVDRGAAGLALIVPDQVAGDLLAHFDKYIVMEDVTVAAAPGLTVLTAQGPAARGIVGDLGEPAFPCDRLETGGHDVIVPKERADALLAVLVERATASGGGLVGAEGWELARLRAGIPELGPDFGPTTLPQEAGLAERAVSFKKGCYLGQEVVCMLENRGKLRRRLVAIESADPLASGQTVRLDTEVGAEVGVVTTARRDGLIWRAFALLRRSAAEPGVALRVGDGAATVRVIVGSGGAEGRAL